jgi:hypothetical protein
MSVYATKTANKWNGSNWETVLLGDYKGEYYFQITRREYKDGRYRKVPNTPRTFEDSAYSLADATNKAQAMANEIECTSIIIYWCELLHGQLIKEPKVIKPKRGKR